MKADDLPIGTSADWVRGYKWALTGGDPPAGHTSKSKREMFLRGYKAGKEVLERPPARTIWEYARAS